MHLHYWKELLQIFIFFIYNLSYLSFRCLHPRFILQEIDIFLLNTWIAIPSSSFQKILPLLFLDVLLALFFLIALYLLGLVYLFMQFKLISLLEILTDAETHQMIRYLYWDCPLRIVNIWEVIIFLSQLLRIL